MCLLGCSGFAFLRENAKKKFGHMYAFFFHLFPLYRVFSALVYLFVLNCLFSLKFTYPNSPFCVFSFFHFSLLVTYLCDYCFVFPAQKKKKKKAGEGLFMVKCTRASEHGALRSKLNLHCYRCVKPIAVSSLV